MKKITFLLLLFTFSFGHMSAQFTEGFEAGIPATWTVINGGDPNGWVAGPPGTAPAHTGNNVAKLVYGSVAHDDYLITQQFTVVVGQSDRFSFWYKRRTTYPEPFDVLLSSGGNTVPDFTVTIAAAVSPTATWQEISYDLTAYAGQTVYIAFHSTTTDQFELNLDDVSLDTAPTDALDYYNLQYPATGNITNRQEFNVYAQAYEAGLTDITTGQAPGIEAWIGYSTANTDPSTSGWTWVAAGFNVEVAPSNNNDEYVLNLGAAIAAPGTYYYASRWRLNGGVYTYGGIQADETYGGMWGDNNNISGILTVNGVANDACSSANVVTSLPYNFSQTDGTGSTNNDGFLVICENGINDGLWYTFTPLTSGTVDISLTNVDDDFDPQMNLYSGSCETLVCVIATDGGGTGGNETLTGQEVTAGTQYYINVGFYGQNTDLPEGNFDITITGTVTLSLNEVNHLNTFTYFPNPVKNTLNLNAKSAIQNVTIYNMLGQEVSESSPNNLNSEVDMSTLQTGAYFVKVTINDASETIRVIKQ